MAHGCSFGSRIPRDPWTHWASLPSNKRNTAAPVPTLVPGSSTRPVRSCRDHCDFCCYHCVSVFTVEQRDALRERVQRLGEEDERVRAGALVGSLAVDG